MYIAVLALGVMLSALPKRLEIDRMIWLLIGLYMMNETIIVQIGVGMTGFENKAMNLGSGFN